MMGTSELNIFLSRLNLQCYEEKLVEEGFDSMISLGEIQQDDMIQLNIKLGHRRLLLKALDEYKMAYPVKWLKRDDATGKDPTQTLNEATFSNSGAMAECKNTQVSSFSSIATSKKRGHEVSAPTPSGQPTAQIMPTPKSDFNMLTPPMTATKKNGVVISLPPSHRQSSPPSTHPQHQGFPLYNDFSQGTAPLGSFQGLPESSKDLPFSMKYDTSSGYPTDHQQSYMAAIDYVLDDPNYKFGDEDKEINGCQVSNISLTVDDFSRESSTSKKSRPPEAAVAFINSPTTSRLTSDMPSALLEKMTNSSPNPLSPTFKNNYYQSIMSNSSEQPPKTKKPRITSYSKLLDKIYCDQSDSSISTTGCSQESGRRRKYKKHPLPDPNAPKPPLSGYQLWLQSMNEGKPSTTKPKGMRPMYLRLTKAEKEPFETIAREGIMKYRAELERYKMTKEYENYQAYTKQFESLQAEPGNNSSAS